MISHIQAPEFWIAVAFFSVVIVFMRPVVRWVSGWSQKQADAIRAQQQEAADLLKKAGELKQEYEQAYKNRMSEWQKMMDEADKEIHSLEAESNQRTQDRILHHTQEVKMRLKMISESGRRDIKRQMLNRVIRKTYQTLEKQRDAAPLPDDSEVLLKQACRALDSYAPALEQLK